MIISTILFSCGKQKSFNEKNKSSVVKNSNTGAKKNKSEKLAEIGFKLVENECLGEIKFGLNSKKLIELIGEPEKKSKLEIFAADGLYHQEWRYSQQGIDFDLTGKSDSTLVLNCITITRPSELKTKRKIGIGSSRNEVQMAYSEEIDTVDLETEYIVAGTIYSGIIFKLENSKVKSIFIGAAAE